MKVLFYIILLLIGLTVGGSVFVRLAPLDAQALHVNPTEVTPPANPNYALLAGTTGSYIGVSPDEVAGRLVALAEALGATLLAGAPEDGLATYVVRTRLMGFPDIVSVSLTAEGAGTQVDLFSRSVYGYSDMGVNTARAQDWMQSLRGATVFSDGD